MEIVKLQIIEKDKELKSLTRQTLDAKHLLVESGRKFKESGVKLKIANGEITKLEQSQKSLKQTNTSLKQSNVILKKGNATLKKTNASLEKQLKENKGLVNDDKQCSICNENV